VKMVEFCIKELRDNQLQISFNLTKIGSKYNI